MHVIQRVPKRMQKRTYLASERQVVNNIGVGSAARYNYNGLGEVDGLFNVGKMFTRMFTFTPSSFKLKNIVGAIGSAAMFTASGGLSTLAPKATGAHSSLAKGVGYGVIAGAAATGAYFGGSALLSSTGTAAGTAGTASSSMMAAGTGVLAPVAETSFFALPSVVSTGSTMMAAGTGVLAPAVSTGAGFLATAGSVLSTVGSGLMTAMQALPLIGGVFGGGGGSSQQGGGETADQYYERQRQEMEQARIRQAEQDIYNAQVRAQQAQMYQPGGYSPSIPFVGDQYSGPGTPAMSSYGDLRTPYTAIQEDGTQVQVDPRTGQVIQAGMIPDLSPTTWLAIGGATLVGWYFMSGSKSNN